MRHIRIFGILVLLLTLAAGPARAAGSVSVRAVVDQQEVVVGEGFTLQVQVEGSDSPEEPDMTGIADFTVEGRGGQQNSSDSVSIVNGHMERVSRHGYVFTYSLTPKREGRLLIPALTVLVDKQPYRTQAIPIQVSKPQESDDFKLRLSLDKERVYVGEPLTLTVTWYIGKDVKGFNFNLPLLGDPRFTVGDGPKAVANPKADNLVRIPAPGGDILAEKGSGALDGNNYLTVSFTKTLVPKEVGRLTLAQATVSCQAVSGLRQGGGRDPFSGFFPDDFFNRSRQVLRTVVVPSNQPTIEVVALPSEGKPADFSGLVGSYSLAVSASPTKVKVGDPITLTIQVAGPAVAGVDLPWLSQQLGERDFKVPEEMAPGQASAELKTFTQTVRARHGGVTQVPSLHLNYFNPTSGRYETASSQPVPLSVAEAKTVTAKDAEGGGSSAAAPAGQELKSAKGGINFNYEGQELLEHQEPVGRLPLSPLWYALLLGPALAFVGYLLAVRLARLGERDPAGRRARQAKGHLLAALGRLAAQGSGSDGYQALGQAMRDYLGARLRRNPASLTYVDVEAELLAQGASPQSVSRLRQVMDGCEAAKYAGPGLGVADLDRLLALARQVGEELG